MGIFIFMYFCLFLFWAVSGECKRNKDRKIICTLSFFLLWSIQSLRDISIGTDLSVYIPFFKSSINKSLTDFSENRMEYGYQLLNNFIAQNITTEASVFLSIISAIFLIPICYIIYKYSKIPALSFIIFSSFIIYHFSFSGLRQAIAVAFTFFSYKYIVEHKLIKFILCITIGICFHTSALIFLIAYPLCNKVRLSKLSYIVIGAISLFGLFLIRTIASLILTVIFNDGRYDNYISDNYSGAYMFFILLFIFFIFTFFVREREVDNYRKMIFCALLIQSLGFISPTATRIGYYFLIFICLAVPEVTCAMKNKQLKNLYNIGIALFMVFFFFYTNIGGYLDVIPYKFI